MPWKLLIDDSITPNAKIVYGIIQCTAGKGKGCELDNESISHFAGMNPTNTSRRISELDRNGWLTIVRKGNVRAMKTRLVAKPET